MPEERKKKRSGGFVKLLLFMAAILLGFYIARPTVEKRLRENGLEPEDFLQIAETIIHPKDKVSEASKGDTSIGAVLGVLAGTVPKEALVAEKFSTFEEVMNFIGQRTAAGETEFTFPCTAELYRSLLQERTLSGSDAVCTSALDDMLESFAGASAYTYTLYESLSTIQVDITEQMAGYKIIAAWENQNYAHLSDTEKETYIQANYLAQELKRGTDAETARAINDWICSSVTYTVDDNSEEDDSAVGAILRGKANCDGYSDAFYLLGTLAGLKVSVIVGDETSDMKSSSSGSGHMWNLLKIDGAWHHVDVTWADDDEYGMILYCWFNVGSQEMLRTHLWNRDSTVEIAEETDLSCRPENEYRVYSVEDYQNAVSDAVWSSRKTAFFVFDSEEQYQQREELENCLRAAGFYGNYSYMDIDQALTVMFVNPYGTA